MNHQEIYQLLKYRRQELCSRMQSIKNDFSQRDEMDDVLFTLAHETKVELANVKLAIENIEDGNFGVCQHCGQPITAQTLNEDPTAVVCDRCRAQGY